MKHKRHITFSQRLQAIDIDIKHQEQQREDDGETETHFKVALDKWIPLNCTRHFDNFTDELKNDMANFDMLVLYRNETLELLEKHLKVPKSTALPPLFELLVALAKDLQVDFYKFFAKFFKILVDLMNLQDADILERLFICLANLFQILKTYMLKDINKVYRMYTAVLIDTKPFYIKDFAAQSFALLFRKVNNKGEMLNLMFSKMKPNLCEGIGLLLFEVQKGVVGQFHSCANEVLPMILERLGAGLSRDFHSLPFDHVLSCVTFMMKAMAAHVAPDHVMGIWKMILVKVESLGSRFGTEEAKLADDQVTRILQVALSLVKSKHNRLITNAEQLAKSLEGLLEKTISDACGDVSLSIYAQVLLSNKCQVSSVTSHAIHNLIFHQTFSPQVVFGFCFKIFKYSSFAKVIEPQLQRYCAEVVSGEASHEVEELVLHLLVRLCTRSSNNKIIDFNHCDSEDGSSVIPSLILHKLEVNSNESVTWACLRLLSHVRPMNTDESSAAVWKLVSHVIITLRTNFTDETAFVFKEAIQTCAKMSDSQQFVDNLEFSTMFDLLREYKSSAYILEAVKLYVEHVASLLSSEIFNSLLDCLVDNLSSPYHKIRHLSASILSSFNIPKTNSDDTTTIFDIMVLNEEAPLDILTFQQRLVYLNKLDPDFVNQFLPQGISSQIPLRYLLGVVSCNFKPLWKPCIDIIAKYPIMLGADQFWNIFYPHLDSVVKRLGSVNTLSPAVSSLPPLATLFHKIKVDELGLSDKPDFYMQRDLLWQVLNQIPNLAEKKNRDVIDSFLTFIREEYMVGDTELADVQDISRKVRDQQDGDSGRVTNGRSGRGKNRRSKSTDDDDEAPDEISFGPTKRKKMDLYKSLITQLSVLSKFKKPKQAHREQDLYRLYLDLLSHTQFSIQRAALDCIVAYKHQYLTAYQQQLTQLTDIKLFVAQLSQFNMDEEHGVVKSEHRQGLLPIVMRILLARVKQQKLVLKKKINWSMARERVLRFFAGCQQHEVEQFLHMVFAGCDPLLKDNAILTVTTICEQEVNLSAVLPLRKQIMFLQLMTSILSNLSPRLDSSLDYVFHILVTLLSLSTQLLKVRTLIDPRLSSQVVQIKKHALRCLRKVFASFDDYEFSANQIEALFTAGLKDLLLIGDASPGVLEIVVTWSEKQRYWPLLGKFVNEDRTEYSLTCVIGALSKPKLPPSTGSTILQVVRNLLDDQVYEEAEYMHLDGCLDLQEVGGVTLLQPHMSTILHFLQQLVKKRVHSKEGIKDWMLVILFKMSEYVTDQEDCSSMADVLLVFLLKNKFRTEDMEVYILKIIDKLVRPVTQYSKLLGHVTKLLGTVEGRNSRVHLCDVLLNLVGTERRKKEIAQQIAKLNSWDPQHPEDPDYTLRLDAYDEIRNRLMKRKHSLDQEHLLLIVHNCCYFILHVKDLVIKENSSKCINEMAALLGSKRDTEPEAVSHVMKVLQPIVLQGIQHKDEETRHVFIGILASLVQHCPLGEGLADLDILTDQGKKFLREITSVKWATRKEALLRLADNPKLSAINASTLLNYVLPIVTVYLFNPDYEAKVELVNATIKVVGRVSSYLGWYEYEGLLKRFLAQLEISVKHEDQAARVVVSILNSFHFDLSRSSLMGKQLSQQEEQMEIDAVEDSFGPLPTLSERPGRIVEKEVLEPELATDVHSIIVNDILPKLLDGLTPHKASSVQRPTTGKYSSPVQSLRIRVGIAIVKLLQLLPDGSIDKHLPTVLLKVTGFLRLPSQRKRDLARITLCKMMACLGPTYLPYVLKVLQDKLSRGDQVYVLIFTMHKILLALNKQLSPGDLDPALHIIIKVCHEELFGLASFKTPAKEDQMKEAEHVVSFRTYKILGGVVTSASLSRLVEPLQLVLHNTQSNRALKRVQTCLRKISHGLITNPSIDGKTLLMYLHKTLISSLADMKIKPRSNKDMLTPEQPKREDTLFIPAQPRRAGYVPKVTAHSSSYVTVWFSLLVLHFSIKNGKLDLSSIEQLEMLDPFVQHVVQCLNSEEMKQRIKVVLVSVECLMDLLVVPSLPSLKSSMKQVVAGLFRVLHRYCGADSADRDTQMTVAITFRAMTLIIKHVSYQELSQDQLRVLLTYVQQDLGDYTRQNRAFKLMQCLIARKVQAPELDEVMKKFRELTITADVGGVQESCRQLFIKYLVNYPHGGRLNDHVDFVLQNLGYEGDLGRMSTLIMLSSLISDFPQKILSNDLSAKLLFPVAIRLVEDESVQCRKKAADAIKLLFKKVTLDARQTLVGFIRQFLEDKKVVHRRLAAQVCGLFVESVKDKFSSHLSLVLDVLVKQLQTNTKIEDLSEDMDHLLFYTFNTLTKIVKECHVTRDSKWRDTINTMCDQATRLLRHPHLWVRQGCVQMFGQVFADYTMDDFTKTSPPGDYMLTDTNKKVNNLVDLFLYQYKTSNVSQDLSDQVTRNLVYLGRVLAKLQVDLTLFITKLCRYGKKNVGLRKSSFYKWVAAMAMDLGKEGIIPYLPLVLRPLVLSTSSTSVKADQDLKALAQDSLDCVKEVVGDDETSSFGRCVADIRMELVRRQAVRLQFEAQLAVNDPVKAAKRKLNSLLTNRPPKKRRGGSRSSFKEPCGSTARFVRFQ